MTHPASSRVSSARMLLGFALAVVVVTNARVTLAASGPGDERSAAVDLLLDEGMPEVAPTVNESTAPAPAPTAPQPAVVKDPPGVFKIPGPGAGVPSAAGATGRSLTEISRRMHGVAERIEGPSETRKDVDFEQRRIVRDLDLLIAAMEAACKGGQCQSSGSKPGNKPGGKPGNKPGNKPATGSPKGGSGQPQGAEGTMGRPAEGPLTALERQQLVDQVWGHLPAAARKQMQQSAGERYHPKYEREIEAYFRRLAEPQAP